MRKLPPLNALRAFESAARCGSFVQAGLELNVSSAAVSLQVKNLEIHLGKTLFIRQGNQILLTDAGEAMARRLFVVFSDISELVQSVMFHPTGPRLVISVLPALAELWLLPKIQLFRQKSAAALEIRIEEDPVNFPAEGLDLRLSYGSTYYAGYQQIPLLCGDAVAVSAPDFWRRYSDPKGALTNVPDDLFIHNNWGDSFATAPSWRRWFAMANIAPRDVGSGLQFNDITLAIAAARHGLGIALAPFELLAKDLNAGNLTLPSTVSLKADKHYVAIFSNARSEYAPLVQFLKLIKQTSQQQVSEQAELRDHDTDSPKDGR